MRFLIILFALITASFSTKDRCGEGYGSCDEDECCSEYGWCGLTEEHCGTGCQSEYGHCDNDSKDRCGKEYGKCENNECCSQYGWCGNSDEHCGTGCQSKYGNCKSVVPPDTDDNFVPGEGKIEWAGFRFSEGGVKQNYGKIPDGNSWIEFVTKMKRNFNEDAKSAVVVIVSQNSEDVINVFGFPALSGCSETKYIKYDSEDKFEDILTKFDEVGFNVWLQVEPGDNDIIDIAKIVFKQYGHHTCVKGFGIDLEWWYRRDDGKGSKLSDEKAKEIVNYIRSINPES